MQPKNNTGKGGGNFDYLIPEISIFDIAVEQGFAQSESGIVNDIPYDNSWENANQ